MITLHGSYCYITNVLCTTYFLENVVYTFYGLLPLKQTLIFVIISEFSTLNLLPNKKFLHWINLCTLLHGIKHVKRLQLYSMTVPTQITVKVATYFDVRLW